MSNSKPSLIAYTVKNRARANPPSGPRSVPPGPTPTSRPHIELEALPLDGRIVLIEPKAEGETAPSDDAELPV